MTTIISDDEREKQVLDLYYNQRKNTRDIAKILRISFTKIGNILKKEREREQRERERERENGNGKAEEQQQHHQIIPTTSATTSASASLSQTQLEDLSDKQKAVMAYKLYDQGKSPVQVATTLCLTAKEATAYYQDFWKLKRLYQLYQIYPEIEHSLPSFLKLFKGLKKHGLNPQNVEWYVDAMNIGMKLEDLSPDYENLQSENENLYNHHQNLQYEHLQLQQNIRDQTSEFEAKKKAMREEISNLAYTRDELQKSVNNLGESMAELYDKKASLEEFVYKFRSTNDKYNRIKNAVKEHVNRFWSQALREPDKKMLTSIVLSSVIEALRENPERYIIIFNDNNNNDSNHISEQQGAVLEMSQRLASSLIERLVNDTMASLEAQAESKAENTELDIAEDIVETESTDKDVVAKADDTQATAAEEEEKTNSKDNKAQ
jgi:uncharacterized protein YoxC